MRKFRRYVSGATPAIFLKRRAKLVRDIATTESAFSNAFKRTTGMAPKRYQNVFAGMDRSTSRKGDRVSAVDAATDKVTAYYMINCAHPTHFASAIATNEPWVTRLRGIRANASKLSHAELNEARKLDDGNPRELGAQYGDLLRRHPHQCAGRLLRN
jgi:hypothetical protein